MCMSEYVHIPWYLLSNMIKGRNICLTPSCVWILAQYKFMGNYLLTKTYTSWKGNMCQEDWAGQNSYFMWGNMSSQEHYKHQNSCVTVSRVSHKGAYSRLHKNSSGCTWVMESNFPLHCLNTHGYLCLLTACLLTVEPSNTIYRMMSTAFCLVADE